MAEETLVGDVLSSEMVLSGKLKRIQPPSELSLNNVFVVDTSDPVVALLRSANEVTRGAGDIRFTRNTINGVFIPDAYIYRIA